MLYTFIIALLVVYIYDLTDFSQSMLRVLWRYAYKSKPFPDGLRWSDIHPLLKICECSLCGVWWATLISLPIMGELSLPMVGWCGFLSMMTPVWSNLLILIREWWLKAINVLMDYYGL